VKHTVLKHVAKDGKAHGGRDHIDGRAAAVKGPSPDRPADGLRCFERGFRPAPRGDPSNNTLTNLR
jgi:hypothetical protein